VYKGPRQRATAELKVGTLQTNLYSNDVRPVVVVVVVVGVVVIVVVVVVVSLDEGV
jgi:hypothetical protein